MNNLNDLECQQNILYFVDDYVRQYIKNRSNQ
jgi:hypothetical protein